jgi:hypothetical protein
LSNPRQRSVAQRGAAARAGCLKIAKNLKGYSRPCYVENTMKQLYKPALVIFATYAVSALSIWTHG